MSVVQFPLLSFSDVLRTDSDPFQIVSYAMMLI